MTTHKQVSPQALERFQHPRNYGPLDCWDGHARITGPCGDTMEFWLRIAEGRIQQANFTTTGCGTSRAAGSMATELAGGKSLPEATRLEQQDVLRALGGLPAESEHCALLAVNALKAAIGDYETRQQTAQQCDECSDAQCVSKHRRPEESAREMNVPFLGKIPIDPQIVTCGDSGAPYVQRFAASPAAKAFAEVVKHVLASG